MAQIMPETSISVPLIAMYLLFTMSMVALSVILSVIVSNIHYRSTSTHVLPGWMKRFFIIKGNFRKFVIHFLGQKWFFGFVISPVDWKLAFGVSFIFSCTIDWSKTTKCVQSPSTNRSHSPSSPRRIWSNVFRFRCWKWSITFKGKTTASAAKS